MVALTDVAFPGFSQWAGERITLDATPKLAASARIPRIAAKFTLQASFGISRETIAAKA